jgi:hypothetical protein
MKLSLVIAPGTLRLDFEKILVLRGGTNGGFFLGPNYFIKGPFTFKGLN